MTNIERELAKIWCRVLHLDCIGVRDNFLDLGGNSLRMAQVINRVRDAFGVELPLRELFEHPTVASLAIQIGVKSRRELEIPHLPE